MKTMINHNGAFFINTDDLNAYEAGERAFETGQPDTNPYPADDRRNRFWRIGYESGEMIAALMMERELYGKS